MHSHRLLLALLLVAIAPAAPPEGVTRGQNIFRQNCAFCHGPDGTGGGEGPNLMRSSLVRHDENGNMIGAVVRDGRPAKGMPPFPFTQGQIDDIAAFLHWRLQEDDKRSPGNPRDTDLKLLLTGNASAGKQFFVSHCQGCHSPDRDLKGIAKKLAPADLQAQMLYPTDVRKTAIVTTSSGERFEGKLFYEDQFTIAITDSSGWYHSWPRSQAKVEIKDPAAAHMSLLPQYSEADMHNVFAYLETLQ